MTAHSVDDVAKDTAEMTNDVFGRVRNAVSGFADEASQTSSRVASAASDVYDRVKDQLPGATGDAIGTGRQAYARGSDRLGRQVVGQPIEALLLAGAMGYFVGWAANRRWGRMPSLRTAQR